MLIFTPFFCIRLSIILQLLYDIVERKLLELIANIIFLKNLASCTLFLKLLAIATVISIPSVPLVVTRLVPP